jgi:hypothetical protein
MADQDGAQWYWCLRHNRAESTDRCGAELLMGPYSSPEEAAQFAEKAKARNETWDEEDERWDNA